MVDTSLIKSRITCVEYARQHGLPVRKSGDRCKSPFHDGNNDQSFVCYNDWWYSFSDAMGGDVIDLAAELEYDGDRGRAIRALAAAAGVTDSDDGWRERMQNLGNGCALWHSQLRGSDIDYLASRGINRKTIDTLLIGYNGSGLVIPYWRNGYIYDYIVRKYDGSPRYMRSRETDDRTPWGMNTLGRSNVVWLCEGTFDAVSLYQDGKAVLVTTSPNIDTIRSHDLVVLAYDNDKTGKTYTMTQAKRLFANGIKFAVATLPPTAKDISEYYAHGGNIDALNLVPGLRYLATSMRTLQEFRSFALDVSRHITKDALAELFDAVESDGNISASALRELFKIATTTPSEARLADEIKREHPLLRHVQNDGFYEYDGTIWEKIPDSKVRGYVADAMGTYRTANRCTAVTRLLESEVSDNLVFNKSHVWVFSNGTLELSTGVFRESSPSDYCTMRSNYPYIPTARNEVWEEFIHTICDDDGKREEVLQQFAGYILVPDCRYHRIMLFTGNGRNGKSTFLLGLRSVFGEENCSAITPEGLTHDFQLIEMKDSILNIGPDIKPNFTGSEYIIKALAAGDPVSACYKGMRYLSFQSRAKLVFSCNGFLRASDTSDGMIDRMLIVDFPCKFVDNPQKSYERKKDPDLLDKLTKNLPGIFNWVYEGYRMITERKEFTESSEQQDFLQAFKRSSNPIEAFVEDYYETRMHGKKMKRSEVYDMYRAWCESTGHHSASRESFYPAFRNVMGNRIAFEGKRRINGQSDRVIIFDGYSDQMYYTEEDLD